MIVTCPRCLTKFSLPDENLSLGVEVNLRCSRCKEEFSFSPQGDSSVSEEVADPLANVVEDSVDTVDFAEVEQTESPAATADLAPDLEFDEGFEESTDGEIVDSDSPETGAEDEFDVDELFSDTAAAEDEPVVAGDDAVTAAVGEDTIFELSDDFDSDEADFNFVEEPTAGDKVVADDSNSDEADDSSIEDLGLDIDDIDLGDIEFDSLEDEPAPGAAESGTEPGAKPTQIDDDDDFAGLLDSGTAAAIAEPAKLPDNDEKDVVEKRLKSVPEAEPVSGGSQKRALIMVLACFLVLSLALWGGYGLWQRFSVNMAKHLQLQEISNQRLRLPSDRVVIVLRGKLVNTSPKLVTNLKIKGVLLDKAGKVVAEVVTSGGVSFSETELDLLDSKKLAMLENSAVNLPPNGGELPFMLAFYDYPASASDCYVELSSFKVKKGRLR